MSDADETPPKREAERFGAVPRAELASDRRGVELHGLVADAQPLGNRFIGQPARHQLEHVDFPRRQRLVYPFVVVVRREASGGEEYSVDTIRENACLIQCVALAGDLYSSELQLVSETTPGVARPDEDDAHP